MQTQQSPKRNEKFFENLPSNGVEIKFKQPPTNLIQDNNKQEKQTFQIPNLKFNENNIITNNYI